MSRGIRSRRRLRHLEDLFCAGAVGDLSDGELVARFVRGRDGGGEAAFAALVERHGAMVFRVCMQALDDPHAAEDAAQATFLVLARQAGSIRNRPSVSSWLFGVARRASARIRMQETRRRRFESRAAERASSSSSDRPEPLDGDPYLELHAEVDRLPEKYRLPIVLCYFEGLTHDQAASRLRWPVGTVKTRLSRGRERLRSRLERRGESFLLPLPAAPAGPGMAAGLPGRLADAITRAGCRAARQGIAGGAAPSAVTEVTQEVMKAMLMNRLKSAVLIPGLIVVGFGAIVAAQQVGGRGREMPPDAAVGETSDAPATLRLQGTVDYDPMTVFAVRAPFDARVDRVLVDLGGSVKRRDPLLELSSTELAAAKGDYELAASQWDHDRKVLAYKKPLAIENTLPRRELIDSENAEAQSRLKMKVARDKLLLYGLTEKEIEAVKDEAGPEKARMTLRSRFDGFVVRRGAVPGNHYDSKDQLLVIAQLDRLRVSAPIPAEDRPRIQVGQDLTVVFPSVEGARVNAKVESIDPPEDPRDPRARVRTTIPNRDNRYSVGMPVRLDLETISRPEVAEPYRKMHAPSPGGTATERLDAMERKLDRLLGADAERSSQTRILDRLDVLERKIDQLLERRRGN